MPVHQVDPSRLREEIAKLEDAGETVEAVHELAGGLHVFTSADKRRAAGQVEQRPGR